MIEALSRTDSHVAELLDDAALAVQSGVTQKQARAAFVDRVAALAERDGLDGLVKPQKPERAPRQGLDDPHGPEAEAQVKALEDRIKFRNADDPPPVPRGWRVDVRPEAAADLAGIRGEVDKIINRLPVGVRAEVRQQIVFGGAERNGFWDPHERLVAIALNDGAAATARHEEMHVLRSLGLITDREWEVLVDAARRGKLAKAYDVEGRWGAEIKEQFKGDRSATAAALVEETVAEMWARHRTGERFGPAVDGILRRLSSFFEKVRNALAGRGFQSAADVFRRIETGEIASRAERAEAGPVRFSVPERPGGERPRPDAREHNRLLSLSAEAARMFGVLSHPVKLDADHIAAKRAAAAEKRGEPAPLTNAADVRALVEHVLAAPDVATRKDPATWNARRALPDGSWGLVAVSTRPDNEGHLRVKTALIQTAVDSELQIVGALKNEGPAGLRFKGDDPGAYGPIIASVSELDRTARGRALDSKFEELKQRRAAQFGFDPVAKFDTRADPRVVAEAKRLAVQSPGERMNAEGEQVSNLSALAEACKR